MKKVMISFSCGVFISLSAMAYATDSVQTVLFPVKLFFNGTNKTVEPETPIINYNGNAYVPVRFIAENLNAYVDYNHSNQSISFTYSDKRLVVISNKSSQKQDGDFKLSIYSEKAEYDSTEPLKIWSTLDYVGEGADIIHSITPFQYYIKDEAGNMRMEAKLDSGGITHLEKNSEYKMDMPPSLIRFFNYRFSGIKNFEEFINTTPQPNHLKSGKYTVGVQIIFNKGGVFGPEIDTLLFTEFPVIIK